jgi:hypothetical protein
MRLVQTSPVSGAALALRHGLLASPKNRPLRPDVDGEDDGNGGAAHDANDLFQRIQWVQTYHHERDTSQDIHNEQHDRERCRPLLHGQNEPATYSVAQTNDGGGGCEKGGRRGRDANEVVSKRRHHFDQSEQDHQDGDESNAQRAPTCGVVLTCHHVTTLLSVAAWEAKTSWQRRQATRPGNLVRVLASQHVT